MTNRTLTEINTAMAHFEYQLTLMPERTQESSVLSDMIGCLSEKQDIILEGLFEINKRIGEK